MMTIEIRPHTFFKRLLPTTLAMVLLLLLQVGVTAAPAAQASGTIPAAQAAAEPIVLFFDQLTIDPAIAVSGDRFELSFFVRNDSEIPIDELVITVEDAEADLALIALSGGKIITFRDLGFGGRIAVVARDFQYADGIFGLRQLRLTMDYVYEVDGVTIPQSKSELLPLRIVEPTPTPTVTPTNSPIPATQTPFVVTAVPSPIPPAQPLQQPQQPQQPLAQPQPQLQQPAPTDEPSPESSPTPRPGVVEEGDDGGATDEEEKPERDAAVVEFDNVPSSVQPGQPFTMTIQVRNISDRRQLKNVIVDWASDSIFPSGEGAQFYLSDTINSGRVAERVRTFYATDHLPSPVNAGTAIVRYQHDVGVPEIEVVGKVFVLVKEEVVPIAALPPQPTVGAGDGGEEPPLSTEEISWLRRFLRALFGSPIP